MQIYIYSRRIFIIFFDDIIDFIIYESTLYFLSKKYNTRNISRNELRCFLAILILHGYNVSIHITHCFLYYFCFLSTNLLIV